MDCTVFHLGGRELGCDAHETVTAKLHKYTHIPTFQKQKMLEFHHIPKGGTVHKGAKQKNDGIKDLVYARETRPPARLKRFSLTERQTGKSSDNKLKNRNKGAVKNRKKKGRREKIQGQCHF